MVVGGGGGGGGGNISKTLVFSLRCLSVFPWCWQDYNIWVGFSHSRVPYFTCFLAVTFGLGFATRNTCFLTVTFGLC